MNIGIIGFGRFGKLMAQYLAEDFSVYVFNRSDKSEEIRSIGASPVSFARACVQDIVIISVPISGMRRVLVEMAPLMMKKSLLIDVCSVKEYPIQWMKTIMPESVSILATHPMFGPDSAADSLDGRKIVLCRERIDSNLYRHIKSYLKSKGLVVIETTPKEHDQQIAVSLSLTHFIGRTLSAFGASELEIDTEGYKRLLHILDVVEHDTWQLFVDMNRYNRYAVEKRKNFIQAMKTIDEKLDSGQ